MRITDRIARLERVHGGRPTRCAGCGDIDRESRSGPIGACCVLPQGDGTCWCLCKRCGFMFSARLIGRPGAWWPTTCGRTRGRCERNGEARRLKELEQENARLKKLVADLSLDKSMLKEAIEFLGKPEVPSGGGRR